MSGEEVSKKTDRTYLKIIVKGYLIFLVTTVLIFLWAGRIHYWQGWVFSGFSLFFRIISTVLFSDKKELIKERSKPGPGMKWWDKVFFVFYIPAAGCIVLVASLDSGRFHWTRPLPIIFYVISYTVYIASIIVMLWAMYTNRFFSSVVRIQSDRGHHVIDSGPYGFVRHPGYASGIFILISIALIFGSLWALVPAGLAIVAFVIRTWLEDRTLQKELPGYADYAKRVCFRLFPLIW